MKRFIAFALLLTLGACSSPAPELVDSPPVEIEVDPYEGWQSYDNAELGIAFRYPAGYSIVEDSSTDRTFDSGVMETVHIRTDEPGLLMSLYFLSSDYARGIGEGCCPQYADEPIDVSSLSSAVDDLLENFSLDGFYSVYDAHLTTVGGRDAVSYIHEQSYAATTISREVLLPYAVGPFANLQISAYRYHSFGEGSYDMSEEAIQAALDSDAELAADMEWSEEEQMILDSLEFL